MIAEARDAGMPWKAGLQQPPQCCTFIISRAGMPCLVPALNTLPCCVVDAPCCRLQPLFVRLSAPPEERQAVGLVAEVLMRSAPSLPGAPFCCLLHVKYEDNVMNAVCLSA
jgi:hypothetical protein